MSPARNPVSRAELVIKMDWRDEPTRLKRRHYIIIGAILVLLVVAGLAICLPTRPQMYEGKTIRSWAMLVAAPDPKVRDEVRAEFKRLGSNAVPVLIRMVQEQD